MACKKNVIQRKPRIRGKKIYLLLTQFFQLHLFLYSVRETTRITFILKRYHTGFLPLCHGYNLWYHLCESLRLTDETGAFLIRTDSGRAKKAHKRLLFQYFFNLFPLSLSQNLPCEVSECLSGRGRITKGRLRHMQEEFHSAKRQKRKKEVLTINFPMSFPFKAFYKRNKHITFYSDSQTPVPSLPSWVTFTWIAASSS